MTTPADFPFPPLQLRRSVISSVEGYVAAEGELVYALDTKKVYVGDGSTPGGTIIGGGGYSGGNLDFGSILQPAGFTLDLGSII
jgi:hypothetical protein